jgi:hypothetical protein
MIVKAVTANAKPKSTGLSAALPGRRGGAPLVRAPGVAPLAAGAGGAAAGFAGMATGVDPGLGAPLAGGGAGGGGALPPPWLGILIEGPPAGVGKLIRTVCLAGRLIRTVCFFCDGSPDLADASVEPEAGVWGGFGGVGGVGSDISVKVLKTLVLSSRSVNPFVSKWLFSWVNHAFIIAASLKRSIQRNRRSRWMLE